MTRSSSWQGTSGTSRSRPRRSGACCGGGAARPERHSAPKYITQNARLHCAALLAAAANRTRHAGSPNQGVRGSTCCYCSRPGIAKRRPVVARRIGRGPSPAAPADEGPRRRPIPLAAYGTNLTERARWVRLIPLLRPPDELAMRNDLSAVSAGAKQPGVRREAGDGKTAISR